MLSPKVTPAGGDRLLVIDMQVIFADPQSPWAAPRFADIVAPVQALVEAFGDKTIFTRFVAPAEPVGAWQAYYRDWPFAVQGPDHPLYSLVSEFASFAGSTVDATTFGKWGPTLGVDIKDRLIVCGVATDCCVLSTVLAAADAGVKILVVDDACAGADDVAQQQALALMARYGPLVEIVTAADVLAGVGAGRE